MMRKIATFISRENGAITVDWVLLTAGIVGFGAIVMLTLTDPIQHVDTETGNALSDMEIVDLNFDAGTTER